MNRIFFKILIFLFTLVPYQGISQLVSRDGNTLSIHHEQDYANNQAFLADSSNLEVPNVFTPNNDGVNDLFYVVTDGNSIYNFKVYSRTGVLVYKSESKSILWDGRLPGGEEVEQGIYYYTIEGETANDKSLQQSGYFYLFK